MKSTLVLLLFFLCLMPETDFAQTFQVPKNFKPEKDADYAKYSKDVLNCINWLESIPFSKENSERNTAVAFLIAWTQGTPDVSISIDEKHTRFAVENADLLTYYVGGWTKYVLEHPSQTPDETKCILAGIRSVLKAYKTNSSFKRQSELDKLAKMDKNGKLEKWAAEKDGE